MQSGCTIYLCRIVENLEWLAAAQLFDKDFRRLCRRLVAHWDAVVEQALQANESIASFNKALH
jgi:phage tail protein X